MDLFIAYYFGYEIWLLHRGNMLDPVVVNLTHKLTEPKCSG
jgi:hypothetical protein